MEKKYERLTKGIIYPLLEQYYQSGDLPSTFYKREGLSESQFYTWRQRYLRDHPSLAKKLGITLAAQSSRSHGSRSGGGASATIPVPSTVSTATGFGQLTVAKPSKDFSSERDVLELCYPNGVRLRLPSATSATLLSSLIKLY